MQIPSSTLRLALFEIFADAGATADSSLTFDDIENAWSLTGLRMSDLRDAIHEMIDSRDLHATRLHGNLGFALTPQGYWALKALGERRAWSKLPGASELLEARSRMPADGDPGLRRRVEDRGAQQSRPADRHTRRNLAAGGDEHRKPPKQA